MQRFRQFISTLKPTTLIGVIALAGLACGAFLPSPTDKTVTPADIAGLYTYEYENKTVSVTLNADGAFEITNSLGLAGSGMWELDKAEITLRFTSTPSGVRKSISGWYVYDHEDGGGFAIMGGEGDPDNWGALAPAP